MTDYASLKVPDLKKLLQERGLQQSGNKADLIARLQDNDKSQAEDVIDWDDDDTKVAAAATKKEEPKAAPPPAVETETDTPAAPASAPAEADPAKPASIPAAGESSTEGKQDEVLSAAVEDTGAVVPATDEKPAEPAESFAIGLEASNADEELKKREARAKRFGISADADSEEAKKLERAQKFGSDTAAVVKGLDAALPERRPKRGREQGDQAEGGGKRQSLDRRNGGQNKSRGGRRGRPNRHEGGGGGGGGSGGKILADPSEKAKAEARAKRFGGGN
ncbi:hypothetical protein Daus18300_004988 [Diaporthe australafricana]|uniref:SAP domain-containing protein n=1 Tax=Diaporthe australafricana TaxID=127596 RepID=A0ABR3X582_9PEZI